MAHELTRSATILVVDDDPGTLRFVSDVLTNAQPGRYEMRHALAPEDGIAALESGGIDMAVIDYFLPGMDGLELMGKLLDIDPDLPVIVLTASTDVKLAIKAMRNGAHNYLTKPIEPDELAVSVEKALSLRRLVADYNDLKLELEEKYSFDRIVGSSGVIRVVCREAAKAARVKSTVLITGESGTGKELFARAIHTQSARKDGPFIKVNCAAIPENLLEAELFGIEKNVATGVAARSGKFEAADGGTIFLDEIGDMAPATQAKILRVLQEKEIERIGGHQSKKIDFRVVAATNKDLALEVRNEKFREDLYYRLNVINLHIPPLRKRREDIPLLVDHFLTGACKHNSLPEKRLGDGVLAKLAEYHWPGNVRELENAIERGVALSTGDTIIVQSLPAHVRAGSPEQLPAGRSLEQDLGLVASSADVSTDDELAESADSMQSEPVTAGDVTLGNLDDVVANYERSIVEDALEKNGWRQNRAAQYLGITERSLWYKIKKLQIEIKKPRKNKA